MSRVMMLGYGPLPHPDEMFIDERAIRTHQLFKPILSAGHTLNLYTLPIPGSEGPESRVPAMQIKSYEGFTYQQFSGHHQEFIHRTLSEQVRNQRPDAIVAVNTIPAYFGASLPTLCPLWVDFNGSLLTYQQSFDALEGSDDRIEKIWPITRGIMRRLDRFSTVTRRHLYAVIGELMTSGRLNNHTFDHAFGNYIPCTIPSFERPTYQTPIFRGPLVPEEAIIILWHGVLDAGQDWQTLIRAMDRLMTIESRIHFVLIEGKFEPIASPRMRIYRDLIAQARNRHRFHIKPSVTYGQLEIIHKEVDLSIHVENPSYHMMFKPYTFQVMMAANAVPYASTEGSEFCDTLQESKALISLPSRDDQGIAATLINYLLQPEKLKWIGHRSQLLIHRDFAPTEGVHKLLQWLQTPQLAPDNQSRIIKSDGHLSDLNEQSLNAIDRLSMLLEGRSTQEIQQAIEAFDAPKQRKKRFFLFGGTSS